MLYSIEKFEGYSTPFNKQWLCIGKVVGAYNRILWFGKHEIAEKWANRRNERMKLWGISNKEYRVSEG